MIARVHVWMLRDVAWKTLCSVIVSYCTWIPLKPDHLIHICNRNINNNSPGLVPAGASLYGRPNYHKPRTFMQSGCVLGKLFYPNMVWQSCNLPLRSYRMNPILNALGLDIIVVLNLLWILQTKFKYQDRTAESQKQYVCCCGLKSFCCLTWSVCSIWYCWP